MSYENRILLLMVIIGTAIMLAAWTNYDEKVQVNIPVAGTAMSGRLVPTVPDDGSIGSGTEP